MKRDLYYKSSDKTIKRIHVGFFPPKGRYFRKEMTSKGDGIFETEVDLPKGKSFHHYFFNGDFSRPMSSESSLISKYDPHKRAAYILETEIFCPLYFENNSTFISHIEGNMWEVRAITHQKWITRVAMIIGEKEYKLSVAYSNKNSTFWNVRIPFSVDEIKYCIQFSGIDQIKYIHEGNAIRDYIDHSQLYHFSLESERKEISDLLLAGGYQVLPDRYWRSVAPGTESFPGLEEWGGKPALYNYFGGNLRGIISRLDHITKLGVDFIYLNPIYLSGSYHRYDCSDYLMIDPKLGTEADFQELVQKCHEKGLKIILDISLNHCSTDFFAFRDVLEKQEQSGYLDWFEIERFPLYDENRHYYNSWHGYKELPQFNLSDKGVGDYFMNVARYWTERFDIDGWRLDVCTEMPTAFIRRFVRETRTIKPNMLVIGEMWHNDAMEFSSDGEIDGITNFTLYLDVFSSFFIHEGLSMSKLALTIMNVLQKNSYHVNQLSWSFLSNHDLPRFHSVIKDRSKYALAFALMYALPGTPVIYYGEELCMEGLGDPSNRGCMPFHDINNRPSITDFLRRLNSIRRSYKKVFGYGSLLFPYLNQSDKVIVIQRGYGGLHVLFAFNFDKEMHSLRFLIGDLLIEEELPAYSVAVFLYNEADNTCENLLSFSNVRSQEDLITT